LCKSRGTDATATFTEAEGTVTIFAGIIKAQGKLLPS
jgi:hypothetical protein